MVKSKISNNSNVQNSNSQLLNKNNETQKKYIFLPTGNYDNFKKINVKEILEKKREEEENKNKKKKE